MNTTQFHAALDTFKTGSYVVTRRTASTYDANGDKVAGSTSTVTIEAIVTPIGGRELEALAPAQVGKETRQIMTETELKTREPGFEPDQVAIAGEPWEVVAVQKWEVRGAVHYRALASRLAVGS